MTRTRLASLALLLLICGSALWLYTSTAVPGLISAGGVESESAQLQRVANRLGIAHSTGYPLHTLTGYLAARLASWLGHNPYTWITYTSSLAGALTLAGFFWLARQVSTAPAALTATALLAVTNTLWYSSTITETQALHALTLTGLLAMTVWHIRQPERYAPLVGMALLGGIGLANHRTSLFGIGAAGLAVLLTGRWRRLNWRQWAVIGLAFILPLLSYGYLFWRAQDPHVVYSTRPTWFPAQVDSAEVVDIIRGTLQTGQGLEGNMALPTEDFSERWAFVRDGLRADLPEWVALLGLLGLGLLAWQHWRLGLTLAVYLGMWVVFLMSWRLDWKSVIYFHSLTVPLVLGLAVLAGWMVQRPFRRLRPAWRHPLLMVLCALPVFGLALDTYQTNRPQRDLSANTQGLTLRAELENAVPPETWFFSGGWSPDTFILLEYLDDSGRRDVIPRGHLDAVEVAQAAQDTGKTVYISPALRGFFGLYSGSTFFRDRGLAFSGTDSPLLFQIRPPDDPRLQVEAEAATVVRAEITPEIDLYSYRLEQRPDRLNVTLYWRISDPVEVSYAVFTHLRQYGDACQPETLQALLAQDDSAGTVRNIHPTHWWQAGEIVKDSYFIPWPEGSLPDETALVAGLTLGGQPQGEFCLPLPDVIK